MGKEERRAFDEALTSMDSLSAESKLSVANLSTSVTFQVNHSSLPKMAFGRNILKYNCYLNSSSSFLLRRKMSH